MSRPRMGTLNFEDEFSGRQKWKKTDLCGFSHRRSTGMGPGAALETTGGNLNLGP